MAQARSFKVYPIERYKRDLIPVIEDYHTLHGEYPVSDVYSTWFEKVNTYGKDDLPILYIVDVSSDGKHLLGDYGHTIIYELPSQANGNQIVFRDVGANGTDNSGLFDDWDSRYGPQIGYWYKKRWPGVYRRAAIAILTGITGIFLITWFIRSLDLKASLCCFWLGLLSGVALPWVGSRSRYTFWQVEYGFQMAGLLFVLGALLLLAFCVQLAERTYHRRKLRLSCITTCEKCKYDLRGTIAANINRCPECGEPVRKDSDKDIDLTPPPSP